MMVSGGGCWGWGLSGVRFEEVSVGYPREWKARRARSDWLREVLPGVPNQGSEEA